MMEELIDDPRGGTITYDLPLLLWSCMLMFMLQRGSRRQFRTLAKDSATLVENLTMMTGSACESVPDTDTTNNVLVRVDPLQIETFHRELIRILIRGKCLDRFRLADESFLLAVDGTQTFSGDERHCPKCLTCEHASGTITYEHRMVEAKLVCGTMVFSIGSEPVENDGPDVKVQDCELNAAFRLMDRIKEAFPEQRFTLTGDALYCCESIMKKMDEYRWDYVLSFKEGRAPNLWVQADEQRIRNPLNTHTSGNQSCQWATNLTHQSQLVHAVWSTVTKKTWKKKRKDEKGKRKPITSPHHFAYITSIRPDAANVIELVNERGRARWKIENQGFNVQKNCGWNLGHQFSRQPAAQHCYYLLMQAAHTFLQMITHSDLLSKCCRFRKIILKLKLKRGKNMLNAVFKTVKAFVDALTRHLAFKRALPAEIYPTDFAHSIQIRFT
jgi:hypothetical protein